MFQGFNDETFEFFMAIRFNNNVDFFHGNHEWYRRSVREPCLALAETLAPVIEQIDGDLERRPNRVVARINRDIRFSHDKSPYRDYLWLSFHRVGGDDRHNHPGFYFDLSSDGGSYGMGYYRPDRRMMDAFRRQLCIEPERVAQICAPLLETFHFCSETYRRMRIPDCVPESLRALYPVKGFYFEKPVRDFELLKSPALCDEIADGFSRLAPLYQYLNSLTPLEQEDTSRL